MTSRPLPGETTNTFILPLMTMCRPCAWSPAKNSASPCCSVRRTATRASALSSASLSSANSGLRASTSASGMAIQRQSDRSVMSHPHELRVEHPDHVHQVLLQAHDLLDRLVHVRVLIQVASYEFDAPLAHLGPQVAALQFTFRLAPAQHPAAAVTGGLQALRVALAFHQVGGGGHAAGDDTPHALARGHGSLAVYGRFHRPAPRELHLLEPGEVMEIGRAHV